MTGDFIQIVDAALAESVRKAGHWLACRPGCSECCNGPFPISPLDAERLREGLADLASRDSSRVTRILDRARRWREAGDEPCPALDPDTGTCDLYSARPLTCRTFGPPVRCESGALAICDLCFDGATEAEIQASIVDLDVESLDPTAATETTVALALLGG